MKEDIVSRAIAHLRLGQRTEAFALLVEAKQEAAGNSILLKKIAECMGEAGQHGSAVEILAGVVRAQPLDVDARLSLLRAEVNMPGDAASLYGLEVKAIGLSLESHLSVPQWLGLSSFFERIGRRKRATYCGRKAFALQPRSFVTIRHLVYLHRFAGQHWRAWLILRRFSTLSSLQPEELHELALLSHACRSPRTALRYASRYTEATRGKIGPKIVYCRHLAVCGDEAKAAQIVRDCLGELLSQSTELSTLMMAATVLSSAKDYHTEYIVLEYASGLDPSRGDVKDALLTAKFMSGVRSQTK